MAANPTAQTVTHRRVLKIALPIVLSNASVPLLGIVDTGVIGQLGSAAAIGAVGIGVAILTFVFWLFGFVRMGTTGLSAQAIGAGDKAEEVALLVRAMMIAMAAGLLLIIAQVPIFWLWLKISPASTQVEELARTYLNIRIWGAPFAIAIYGLTGWMIARERSAQVLLLTVCMHSINMLLDFWFVLGLGWGVEGVAIATLIAEVFGCTLGLLLCAGAFKGTYWRTWARIFDKARLQHMFNVNRDIMIRSALLLAMITAFTFYGSSFGDDTLAANHILMQFIAVTGFALDGFAFSAEVIVGQTLGAKAVTTLRRDIIRVGLWSCGFALVMALGFAIFGGTVIDLMTTAPDVQSNARTYLPWMVAAPLVGVLAWVMDGVFIGATRAKDMRNMMLISAVIYAAALFALMPIWGNHGLWAALLVSYVVRGLTLLWKYPQLERSA